MEAKSITRCRRAATVRGVLAVVACGWLGLAPLGVARADELEPPIRLEAHLEKPGHDPLVVEIAVERWTSDEELQAFRMAVEKSPDSVRDALGSREPVGRVNFRGGLSTDVRVARRARDEGATSIVLLWERLVNPNPISEQSLSNWLERYDAVADREVVMIVLHLEGDGPGDGQMIAVREMSIGENGSVDAASAGKAKLTGVRLVD